MSLIDLNKIAIEALRLFGEDDRSETVQNFARRKYLSKLSKLKEKGESINEVNVQEQLNHLDYLILTLDILSTRKKRPEENSVQITKISRNNPDLEILKKLAGSVFHAPTDGSRKRARVLSKRAIQLINEEIKKSDIGFFERRKLRKSIKKFIRELAEATLKESK